MDKVQCKICGGRYFRIGNHLPKHKMTIGEYIKMYPNAPTCSYIHSEETKSKMSGARLTMRGKPKSASHRKKLSECRKGKKFKPHSPETIAKMKEAWRLRKANTEQYEKYVKSISDRMKTPEMLLILRERFSGLIKNNNHNGKSSNTSLERKMSTFLDDLNVKYETQYILDTKKGKFTFDFFLQDQHILLETDGEYWHRKSLEQFNRDVLKQKLAEDLGFTVVRISDSNWVPEIIFAGPSEIKIHNEEIMKSRRQLFDNMVE